MKISYHTHSTWSDGSDTMDTMVAVARAQGIEELGFSDHYTMSPHGDVCWSMPLHALGDYVAAVLRVMAATETPVILLGVEADYFPETIDTLTARLAEYPFDYIIGAVHIVDGFSIDTTPADWEPLSQDERNAKWRLYYTRLREMVACPTFDIVAHLDLPKKFGFFPTFDVMPDVLETLDAIEAANKAVEINTAGWHKDIAEAYPSETILREAFRREIPLVINADAHSAPDLARDFDRAYALAARVGYTQVARYCQRERELVAFPDGHNRTRNST